MQFQSIRIRVSLIALALAPAALLARSTGPPIMRTAVPVDGGQDCTVCHRTFAPANSGSGRVSINAAPYTPGQKQTITITVEDPDGRRWGFQLTARIKSDQTKQAGTFTVTDAIRVQCAPEGDAPCNGNLEFASHNATSTKPGTPSPGVFQVEWTPPATDVGDVILYASGNAANGDGTNNGDHIYTTNITITRACNMTGKPSLTAVTDAGSYRNSISPNAIISLFGSGFAPSGSRFAVTGGDLVGGKVPSRFRCVAVEINGKAAPIYYVQDNQINAQAPIVSAGQVDARVILNPGASNEIRGEDMKVQVNNYTPAFFTLDGKHIAALNVPARAGDIVTLYGTGFGFSEPVYQPGEFAQGLAKVRDPITITIGGVTVGPQDILYAGLAPDAPGLYQFNVRVPAGLTAGDVPVSAKIGGIETQSGAMITVR